MQLAARVKTYLEQRCAAHTLISHAPTETLAEAALASRIDPQRLARAVLLEDDKGLLLAVLPATFLIDFRALREICGRNLKPAAQELRDALFSDCEPGSVPPLAEPYGLQAVVDEQLVTDGQIHFEAGFHNSLVCVDSETFKALHNESTFAAIAHPLAALESRELRDVLLPGETGRQNSLTDLRPLEDIRRSLDQVRRLPALPEMANRLLRLCSDPQAGNGDLVALVGADSHITSQIIRYARAPVFGGQERVDTLAQAIDRVLGFDLALSMALGFAASRTFRNPADGPLGLQAFWKQAAYSAALAHQLAVAVHTEQPIRPGFAYLAGLLHNFGYLLTGHLFRGEFFLLNRVVAANPQIPVPQIERKVLGIEHGEMGARLMRSWNMPDEIAVSCAEHHNDAFQGVLAEYPRLMWCVDQLLRASGIGEGADGEPSPAILTALGLDRRQAKTIVATVLESSEALDAMARHLAA